MAAKKRSKAKVSKRISVPVARRAKVSAKRTTSSTKASSAKAPSAAGSAPTAGKKKAPSKVAAPAAKRGSAAKVAKASPLEGTGKAAPAAAPATPASATLAAGDRAPSFELLDQAGNAVSSSELSGHPYVLYFYPKDDTPGCTTQACGFRDALPEFEQLSVRVLGVSPDSVASHQRFVGKYGLTFTLLSDPQQELAAAYGVWSLKKNYGREYMGIVRSTFLIDADGVVRKAWRGVRVNGHVSEVQAAAAALS